MASPSTQREAIIDLVRLARDEEVGIGVVPVTQAVLETGDGQREPITLAGISRPSAADFPRGSDQRGDRIAEVGVFVSGVPRIEVAEANLGNWACAVLLRDANEVECSEHSQRTGTIAVKECVELLQQDLDDPRLFRVASLPDTKVRTFTGLITSPASIIR